MTSNEARKLMDIIKKCKGAEVNREDWPLAEELRETGFINLGSARGPNGDWKRASVVEQNNTLGCADEDRDRPHSKPRAKYQGGQ